METRRFSATSSAPSMSTLRQVFNARAPKEKLPPALKNALDVLNLKGIDGLENHFLATTAFLKPWTHFRDTFLLLQPGSKPRASEIRGMDILWFYTNFSDGELRYDPRADDTTSVFTLDENKYGEYDTTHWGVEEYEKMLYAWLLQEFKVGKARNPFGFQFFELRNVCTAWQMVFVPIVQAVRESYDPRGRRHYGRLARFIEERHPSRVAFPDGNVMVPQSANPYRMVSYPRDRGAVMSAREVGMKIFNRPATMKEEAAIERELRDIYPKYGQLVEKPKNFKSRMTDFIAGQKANAVRKKRDQQDTKGSMFGKRTKSDRESPMFGCRGIEGYPPLTSEKRRSGSTAGRSSVEESSLATLPESPTKNGKDKKLPHGIFGFVPSPTNVKSSLNGVTRHINLPDTAEEEEDLQAVDDLGVNDHDLYDPPTPPKPAFARPSEERRASYSSIRNSNPFTEDAPTYETTTERKTSVDVPSPMGGHPSAIPRPLFNTTERKEFRPQKEVESPPLPTDSDTKARAPSYEGTGYDREIRTGPIADTLHSLEYNAYDQASRDSSSSFMLSEIPEIGYAVERQAPRPIPWPGMTPTGFSPAVSPTPTAWPRASLFENAGPPPPIPPRHPARTASTRSSAGSDLPPPPIPQLLGPRIVSKENIRGHLSNISRDISAETLKRAKEREATASPASPATPPTKWATYNQHMFPRRQDRNGTPVGAWLERKQEDVGGDYELKTFKKVEK